MEKVVSIKCPICDGTGKQLTPPDVVNTNPKPCNYCDGLGVNIGVDLSNA